MALLLEDIFLKLKVRLQNYSSAKWHVSTDIFTVFCPVGVGGLMLIIPAITTLNRA